MVSMKELKIKERKVVDAANPNYYLDKDEMRNALRDHRDSCLLAEKEGRELPPLSNYLGECFLYIAKGLGSKFNFRNYSFVKDMEMDGVMQCIRYVRAFDPDMISEKTGKPVSPLAYFTQTCWYAFINRLKLEEEEAKAKWAILLNSDLEAFSSEDDNDFQMNMSDFIKNLGPQKLIEDIVKKPKKEKEVPRTPLDDLCE